MVNLDLNSLEYNSSSIGFVLLFVSTSNHEKVESGAHHAEVGVHRAPHSAQ